MPEETIYISGPMSGLPNNNHEAFNEAAAKLRALGYTVVNPVEVCADMPADAAWADHMRRDVAALMGCSHIVMLPGWEISRGAGIEYDTAMGVGIEWMRMPEDIQ